TGVYIIADSTSLLRSPTLSQFHSSGDSIASRLSSASRATPASKLNAGIARSWRGRKREMAVPVHLDTFLRPAPASVLLRRAGQLNQQPPVSFTTPVGCLQKRPIVRRSNNSGVDSRRVFRTNRCTTVLS